MKKCSSCKKELPKTTEYFYKDDTCTGGFKHDCKKCYKEERKEKKKDYYREIAKSVPKEKRVRENKMWTDEEIEILNSDNGLSVKELALKLGRSVTSIYMMQHKLKHNKRHIAPQGISISEESKQYIAAWYGKISNNEISLSLDEPIGQYRVREIYNEMIEDGSITEYELKYWEQN